MNERILCVLVLYRPCIENLLRSVSSVINQVEAIWLSDNTPGGTDEINRVIEINKEKLHYHRMNGNEGIACAQNVGLRYGLQCDFDFVFFLDQDSMPPRDIIAKLLLGYYNLDGRGYKVGGVAPQSYDKDTGQIYKPSVCKGKCINDFYIERTELVSSGSLIPVSVFKEIGLMEDALFIDAVDHELCWRARYFANYHFFLISTCLFGHKFGEGDKHFCGITVKIPTAFRTYYLYRNFFLLLRRKYVPVYWKLSNGLKFFFKYFYFIIFLKPHFDYFKNINKGIIDGLLKITHK